MGPNGEKVNRNSGIRAMWIVLAWFISMNCIILACLYWRYTTDSTLRLPDISGLLFVNVAYLVFLLYVVVSVRRNLKRETMIYGEKGTCFYSTFCLPCTIYQMA